VHYNPGAVGQEIDAVTTGPPPPANIRAKTHPMKAKPLLLLLLFPALIFLAGSAAAQTVGSGIFLKLDGVLGDSVDEDHPNEIEIESISFGVNQSGIRSAGGRGSPARSNFSVISLLKRIDKTSPRLFLKCALGEIIPTATFSFETSNGSEDYLQIKLTNVIISNYQTGGNDATELTDAFSLSYNTIEISFKPRLPSGQLGSPVAVSFDVNRNKVLTAQE
jgi:type VI secretion system secreted protein Hcp